MATYKPYYRLRDYLFGENFRPKFSVGQNVRPTYLLHHPSSVDERIHENRVGKIVEVLKPNRSEWRGTGVKPGFVYRVMYISNTGQEWITTMPETHLELL